MNQVMLAMQLTLTYALLGWPSVAIANETVEIELSGSTRHSCPFGESIREIAKSSESIHKVSIKRIHPEDMLISIKGDSTTWKVYGDFSGTIRSCNIPSIISRDHGVWLPKVTANFGDVIDLYMSGHSDQMSYKRRMGLLVRELIDAYRTSNQEAISAATTLDDACHGGPSLAQVNDAFGSLPANPLVFDKEEVTVDPSWHAVFDTLLEGRREAIKAQTACDTLTKLSRTWMDSRWPVRAEPKQVQVASDEAMVLATQGLVGAFYESKLVQDGLDSSFEAGEVWGDELAKITKALVKAATEVEERRVHPDTFLGVVNESWEKAEGLVINLADKLAEVNVIDTLLSPSGDGGWCNDDAGLAVDRAVRRQVCDAGVAITKELAIAELEKRIRPMLLDHKSVVRIRNRRNYYADRYDQAVREAEEKRIRTLTANARRRLPEAEKVAQRAVLRSLRTPSTARIVSTNAAVFAPETRPGCYLALVEYDAQNLFGAMLRKQSCVIVGTNDGGMTGSVVRDGEKAKELCNYLLRGGTAMTVLAGVFGGAKADDVAPLLKNWEDQMWFLDLQSNMESVLSWATCPTR